MIEAHARRIITGRWKVIARWDVLQNLQIGHALLLMLLLVGEQIWTGTDLKVLA